jgi:hypothetical protein
MRLEFSCYKLDGRHGSWLRKIRMALCAPRGKP